MVVDNGMSKAAIIKHIKHAAEKGDPFVFREPTPLTLANLNGLVEDGKLVVAFAAYELPPKVVAPSRIDVLGALGYRWGIYRRPTRRHRWVLTSVRRKEETCYRELKRLQRMVPHYHFRTVRAQGGRVALRPTLPATEG